MKQTRRTITGGENGFSLVETLLAAALLGTGLISVIALFVLGGQYVKSGKELTKATAIGMEMMEDFRRLDFQQAYEYVGGTCADTTLEWRSEEGSNNDPPKIGIPGTVPADECTYAANWSWPTSDDSGIDTLCRWAKKMDLQFPGQANGAVRVKLDGFSDIPDPNQAANGDVNFCDARYLRIRVQVEWSELRRGRDVTFETLKF